MGGNVLQVLYFTGPVERMIALAPWLGGEKHQQDLLGGASNFLIQNKLSQVEATAGENERRTTKQRAASDLFLP